MSNLLQTAIEIIENNLYMVLATSKDNLPWAVPVFYAHDKNYHFYFVSGKETRHVQQLGANDNVAVTIFNSQAMPEMVDGVYIEGKAKEVDFLNLPKVIGLVYRKRFPNFHELTMHPHEVRDFLGGKPRRFYEVTPHRIYKLDRDNDSEADRRVELDLIELCKMVST